MNARRESLPRSFRRSGPGAWQEGAGKIMIEIIPVVAFGAIFFAEIAWITK